MPCHRRRSPRRWTPQEDNLLESQVEIFTLQNIPVNWSTVSSAFRDRSNKDCRKRWQKIDTRWNSGAWTESEDEKLRVGVSCYGTGWVATSALVETRSPDRTYLQPCLHAVFQRLSLPECAKRWRNVVDPSLDHGEWTEEEGAQLYNLVQLYGRDWKLIAETSFPNRSRQDLSNRYALLLRKENNRSSRLASSLCTTDPQSSHLECHISNDFSLHIQHRCFQDEYSHLPAQHSPPQTSNAYHTLSGGMHDSPWLYPTNITSGTAWDIGMISESYDTFQPAYQLVNSSAYSDAAQYPLPSLSLGTEESSNASRSAIVTLETSSLSSVNAAIPEGRPIVSTSGICSKETGTPSVAVSDPVAPQQQTEERRRSKTVITITNLTTTMRAAIVDMVLGEGRSLSIATDRNSPF